MYFGETGTGTGASPVAIKSWFYPGDNFGQRFVYPKRAAVQIAQTYQQPVPSTPEPKPAENPAAPVAVTTPEKTEVVYQAAVFEKHDTQDTAGVDGEAVKEPTPVAQAPVPRKLPPTGSPFPLIGSVGALLLAGSGVLRCVRRRLR